jgi:isoquinoline 1-oxidoreductase beta subunit
VGRDQHEEAAVIVVDPAKTKGSPVKQHATFGLADSAAQSGVAVLADHYWQAKQALEALPVEWENGAGEAWQTTEQIYAAAIAQLDKPDGKVLLAAGDVNVNLPTTVEATYLTPYCENATMEPLNGTALVTDDKVEVWHPCQDTQQAFWVAVDETGMAPEKVEIHQTYVGGAFGRRVLGNDLRMVVAIAKEYPGVPVKVIWSREETMRQGRYRTLIASRFNAGLDKTGMPQSWVSNACIVGLTYTQGYADTPYIVSGAIPNVKVAGTTIPVHILTGAYRAPCYNSHAFMVETFIDECAHAAKIDPLEYRLRLLSTWDPAWSNCLKVAAEKAGWGKPLQKGHGRGIAISAWPSAGVRQSGTIVCAAVNVEVSGAGVLKVKQVDFAFDSGRVANRDAVAAQLEGGVIFGLNMTLNEEITLKDGAVVEGNFDQYPILRGSEIPPKINIHFDALSGHDRFGMMGEAPVGPIGPAVGNAIFQATGKRLRTTPFRKHDLSWS